MSKELTLKEKSNLIEQIQSKIQMMEQRGEIEFPPNYSWANSLKAAWLMLQDLKDKDKQPVLKVCTTASISNSLLKMVTLGLNPLKKQGYFIAYGKTLVFEESYFGCITLAKRARPDLEDIYAQVVYQGDEFDWEIKRGKIIITKHKQNLKSLKSKIIEAAYAEAVLKNDEVLRADVMLIDEIYQSWKQSKIKVFDDKGNLMKNTTHYKFTADMCKRTVIKRLTKFIVNTADDEYLKRAVKQFDIEEEEEEINEMNEEIINRGEIIDIDDDNNGDTGETITQEIDVTEEVEKEEKKQKGKGIFEEPPY